jgi:RND superfamily putative drug exporter
MFERLGGWVVRKRWAILVGGLIFFIVAGVVGGGVAERLSNGGFQDPNAEASVAQRTLDREFGVTSPNIVLMVTAAGGDVDDKSTIQQGEQLTEELASEPGMEQVASYWTTDIPAFRSNDGSQALVIGVIQGDEDEVRDRIEELSPRYTRTEGDLTVKVGGFAEVYRQVGETIEADLVRAESIAFPITLILLVIVFGTVVAASLPLIVGGISIVGAFLILTVISGMTDVSIFALNLVTALGLGLAIDYSLFVVSRFREELRRGRSPHDAVRYSVATAGRTVAFSGITVALSLAALLVFPIAFLKSFAYAGVAVVLLGAITATVFLPAVLAILGTRIEKLRVRKVGAKPEGTGFWHRVAVVVMRRPIPIATIVVALLIFLGLPYLSVDFGLPDDRVLPKTASSHQVSQSLRDDFPVDATNNMLVVAEDVGDVAENRDDIESYATELSQVEGVYAVEAATGTYLGGRVVAPPTEANARYVSEASTYFTVVPSVEAVSPEGERLAKDVRALDAPFDVQVAGRSAELVDTKESLFAKIPLAALLIGLTTFVLLFLMFGGLLVPFKAIILNLLSLTATYGALVWVFQQGHLSESLDFIVTGTLDVTSPILMFCIAFGLSMDYEVFMLSRIKEEYDRSGDNQASVALGLERTGSIVTAAALILSIVFVAFVTSGVTFIKLFGIGLTLAVLMDATLVRGTLVPAFMRLAGRANWWAPRWMQKIHDKIGLHEVSELDSSEPGGRPAATEGGTA